jgi:hypothetical protein
MKVADFKSFSPVNKSAFRLLTAYEHDIGVYCMIDGSQEWAALYTRVGLADAVGRFKIELVLNPIHCLKIIVRIYITKFEIFESV